MPTPTKAKIVVVFVDIRGSSRWTRRMADDEEKRQNFMLGYDRECLTYKKNTGAQSYKRLGDGRMFVHDLNGRNQSAHAALILNECLGLIKRVDRLIFKLPTPRPGGFRARLMAGIVNKESYPDGETDWVGYLPNSCHKFLAVAPQIPCLMGEGFVELIKGKDIKQHGFAFSLLMGDRLYPDGVDREDVETLWTVAKRRAA